MYLFTTCSTSSLSTFSPICEEPRPSGVSGGVEGDVGDGGIPVWGEGGASLSATTGPLLVALVSPLGTEGAV